LRREFKSVHRSARTTNKILSAHLPAIDSVGSGRREQIMHEVQVENKSSPLVFVLLQGATRSREFRRRIPHSGFLPNFPQSHKQEINVYSRK
jgi:hypothetical protein